MGGSTTTTHASYEEHTVTNGEAFSTEEAWGTATAIDSSHAADLRFTYIVNNIGTEYAREIANLAFNIYIGDDPNPVYTYFVAQDIGGSGKFQNFMPGETHQYASRPVPLSLEQMKAIDLRSPIRIVVEDFTYGLDEFFYQDAINAGILFAIEDGTDDGDENIETYLVPTWGQETVLQVLSRAFPNPETDSDGTITALWTPEYRTDTPTWCQSPRRPTDFPSKALRCRHALSTADWWNVYTDGLGNGGEGFQDTPAVPGAVALFRFNKDSDLDGFSDRSEINLGTDPRDAAAFPSPELLAGLHSIRSGNKVTATLSLLNTGRYDAYGIEAVLIAPNDSISITNNTVGGSGRVRALNQVIVGSRVQLQTPLPAQWTQANHARPASGGYYTGNTDRTYTFTVNCGTPGGCTAGSGSWSVGWADGAGASGSLNFGAGYASPNFVTVGSLGVSLALYSGNVSNGESFTVAATTPRDTFQYTINRQPYTEPLVVVSYNDPQGNHRFVVPTAAMSLTLPTDNLRNFAGQMLDDVGIEIVTSAPFAAGVNNVNLLVNNPSDKTLTDAHLFLEFINISGTVVSEVPAQLSLPPGPTARPMGFNTADFNPPFNANEDYIVMAFLTDYQGNIIDTSGRPLSSFQADPLPKLVADAASLDWNFGSIKQGTLLKHPISLANTGFGRLYTYVPPVAGMSFSAVGARTVGAADIGDYELTLRTGELSLGAFDQTVTIATSDPAQPTRALRVQGTVVAGTADTAGGASRPLDVPATFGANLLGTWQTFNHTLGPDPASLHPVKVYDAGYATLLGVGKNATDFGAGTASAEMFGDGRDGTMPGSGNLDNANGFGAGVVNSGSAGSTSINVTDANGVGRINPGDVVLIHQTQGTSAGQWELNKAVTDFTGSGTFSLQKPLQYTYATSGNNKAQILRVPQYATCNVTGTVTPLGAWNGSWGGIFAVMCSGTMNVTGNLQVNGGNGTMAGFNSDCVESGGGGLGGGFRGGNAFRPHGFGTGCPGWNELDHSSQQGEGISGPGTWSRFANENGGGGGGGAIICCGGDKDGPGGGGGHTSAGAAGSAHYWGYGGSLVGTDTLSVIMFGGGGGGGNSPYSYAPSGGGAGGGIAMIFAKAATITGAIQANGGNSLSTSGQTGGGGAGGSILIRAQNANIGNLLVLANGGTADHVGDNWYGGTGSLGRIRIEYCESLNGTSNPAASTQKLNCYIADQAPGNTQQGQLNIPSNTAQTYQIQYGRKLNFASASNQLSQLRVPAGLLSSLTLDGLVSGLSGNTSLSLDVGDDGTTDWTGTASNNSTTAINTAAIVNAFSSYWAAHGAPSTGTLDVPVRVSLGGAGQILLTNVQAQLASSSLRYIKLPVRNYTQFLLDFTAGSAGQVLAALDVGDDGSIDWNAPAPDTAPKRWLTGDLKTAINAYLAGKSGDVELPIRIYVTPSGTAKLNDYEATYAASTDLVATSIGLGPTVNALAGPEATDYNAGDVLTLQANLGNSSGTNSGPLTAAFFAYAEGWGDWYVGSAFVSNIVPGGSATIRATWNTTGFGGNVPVKVVVNPYGRTGETSFGNNAKTMTVTVTPQKADQTITFGELTSRLMGDPAFVVVATASSGLMLTFTSLTPAVCSVAGNTVSLLVPGLCTVRASQPGSLYFNAAASVDRSFVVRDPNKLDQMIAFAALPDKTYGDAAFAVSATSSAGLAVRMESLTPSVCIVANDTVTVVAAGACTLRASQLGNATYNPALPVDRNFVVQKANQVITFGVLPDRALSEGAFTVSATSSSGLPVSFRSLTTGVCSVSASTVSLLSLGQCSVEASQEGNGNVNAATAQVRSFKVVGSGGTQSRVFLPMVLK